MSVKYKQICSEINAVIDLAFFHEQYDFNFFEYLKENKVKKIEINEFLNSIFTTHITDQIQELILYLQQSKESSVVLESYDWMGIVRANKLKDYLENIMEDAKSYEKTKRGGRPRKHPVQS